MKRTHEEAPALTIDRQALSELHSLALSSPPDLSKLDHREAQQALTLQALIKFFELHGLRAPFKLDL